jgi:hypothetical protein
MKKAVVDFVAQATELKLSINVSNCAILIFGKQKTEETIEIDNAKVIIANNYKYLQGITIDRHFCPSDCMLRNFTQHYNED